MYKKSLAVAWFVQPYTWLGVGISRSSDNCHCLAKVKGNSKGENQMVSITSGRNIWT